MLWPTGPWPNGACRDRRPGPRRRRRPVLPGRRVRSLRSAKAAAPETPVLANTGVQADRLAEILPAADGVIVGTSLKVDGITWNPVDPDRARRFTETAAKVRASLPVPG